MKPNELTLAIERVEELQQECLQRDLDAPHENLAKRHRDRFAALRLVIEAAKRPTALSGEERKTLEELRRVAGQPGERTTLKVREIHTALTAALSLASPFTREQLELIQAACDECRPRYEEGYTPILATLDAMLAQSSPANSSASEGV